MAGVVVNTPYSRPLALDLRAIDTWNRRNKAARDANHDATKDARGRFRGLGEHDTHRLNVNTAEVETTTCACVRCDP